jgi:aldehyde dehydrogenase (NAD+)
MNQLVVEVAPALAAGCTTVTKLSEYSPLSSMRFAELVDEAGSPASVYNHITGFRETAGEGALASPDVAMVSFTGSTCAGVAVARAGRRTQAGCIRIGSRQGRDPARSAPGRQTHA